MLFFVLRPLNFDVIRAMSVFSPLESVVLPKRAYAALRYPLLLRCVLRRD
jgi:hypothetical protein